MLEKGEVPKSKSMKDLALKLGRPQSPIAELEFQREPVKVQKFELEQHSEGSSVDYSYAGRLKAMSEVRESDKQIIGQLALDSSRKLEQAQRREFDRRIDEMFVSLFGGEIVNNGQFD